MDTADVTGRAVNYTTLKLNTTAAETMLSIDDLNNGNYFVTMMSATINYTSRLIVQKQSEEF